jgi:hypothetical protein
MSRANALIDSGNTYFTGVFMVHTEKAGNGKAYGLHGRNQHNGLPRRLLEVYPDAPSFVETTARSVSYFLIADEDIYLVGEDASGRNRFLKMRLGLPSTEEDLLSGEEIQIYHFVLIDQYIYFDGLRFSDNKLIIGRIDQNEGNEMIELTPLQVELIDLQFVE